MLYTPNDPTQITPSHDHEEHELRELEVLAHVHRAPDRLSQRSIARAFGMSVGLTNAILRRLADKGFLMMRRINQHNVHYLVTPTGIDQIGRRSYLYLRRTIGHVVRYKERLRAFCRAQKRAGIREIVLVGESDLTFILEWCAEKEGIDFSVSADGTSVDRGKTRRVLLGENGANRSSRVADSDGDTVYLDEILIGYPADSIGGET